jgi:hypothetical protein
MPAEQTVVQLLLLLLLILLLLLKWQFCFPVAMLWLPARLHAVN